MKLPTLAIIQALDKLEREMTTAPFKACTVQNNSNEMMIASLGDDHQGFTHIVTTDYAANGVRPSDCNCDPEADAQFIALVRNHWREISEAWKGIK